MAEIGILGSGRVARSLATQLASAGHAVHIGTRDVERATNSWSGPRVTFTDHAEAAAAGSIVINATPGATSVQRLSALRQPLGRKILIDVANATERGADGLPGQLIYPRDSLAERLQAALPDTAVVKALNTMLFTVMADPRILSTPPTVFLSGNDPAAKDTVCRLLADLGWRREWIEDLGDITSARGPEAIALLVPAIIRQRGVIPFALALAR